MCVGVCVKEREREIETEEWDGNVYLPTMQTTPQGRSRESPEHTEACHKHTYTPTTPIPSGIIIIVEEAIILSWRNGVGVKEFLFWEYLGDDMSSLMTIVGIASEAM